MRSWPRFQEQTSSSQVVLIPAAAGTALVLFRISLSACICDFAHLRGAGTRILLAQPFACFTSGDPGREFLLPVFAVSLAAVRRDLRRAWYAPFFWGSLTVSAFGSLGVGLTISSLRRTQRTASMTACVTC